MQYFGFDRPSFGIKTFGFGDSFDPLDLFAGGKQGVWYDPSDKSTLFQDVAGTVPVTKDGDPVGLILDKSQGLILGEEKNLDIALNDPSKWTGLNEGYAEIENGINIIKSYANVHPKIIDYVAGSTYKVVIEISEAILGVRLYRHNDLITNLTTVGTHTFYFKAESSTILFSLVSAGTATGGVKISRLSIKEIKGNHASQTLSAARPLSQSDSTKSWLYNDKVDDNLTVTLPAMTATVVKATDEGVSIDYPVSITAGGYAITSTSALGRDYGHLIINKELSASEVTQVTNYFNTKRGD